ncbi:MAG: carbohydrate ABC transporter permease [bacterium]
MAKATGIPKSVKEGIAFLPLCWISFAEIWRSFWCEIPKGPHGICHGDDPPRRSFSAGVKLEGGIMQILSLRRREVIAGYVFLLPWIIGFVGFTAGPIIASATLSFYKYDVLSPPKFIGLKNYINMFTEEPLFWKSLRVTAKYVFLSVPLNLVGALLLAVLMNQGLRGITFFRALYFLPSILSGVAVAFVWSWVLQPQFGVINYFLDIFFHVQGPPWLGSEAWVIPAFVLMQLWALGGGMVIFLAGLNSIPDQLYEAAKIDGAGVWQRFWRITIPLLTPTIFFNLVMGIINSWQVFTSVFVLTGGGPNYASWVYVLYIYNEGWVRLRMGYASALAWFLFVIVLVCTLLVFKSSPMWVYYETERKMIR